MNSSEALFPIRMVFTPMQKNIILPSMTLPPGLKKATDYALLNMKAELYERVGKALQTVSNSSVVFEENLKSLSISTGISGEALEVLSANARKIGVSTGLGAGQALKAYQVLASQIDISKVGLEGLNALQAETMTLAKASGLGVEGVAMALSATINQFGLEASEANRVINVLAAGAKYGAAGIPELAEALGTVGAVARNAGVNVESASGALEVLSRGNLKGVEAGRALEAVMQGMQSSLGIDFNNTSLASGLEVLKPRLNDVAYLTGVFGANNMEAAQYLIANAAAVQEMTDKVTDSNVAQEQASFRSETVASRMAVAREWVDNLKYSIFELTGGWSGYLSLVGEGLAGIANFIPLVGLLGKGFGFLKAQTILAKQSMNALTLSVNRQTIAQKLQKLSTAAIAKVLSLWRKAQWLTNAAMYACPIVWIVLGIAALVAGIVLVIKKFDSWGAALLSFLGPIGWVINAFMILKNNWESIVEAFKTDGIFGGLKRIGVVLLDTMLYPVQQFLTLLGKIPGFSFARKKAEKIQAMRDSLKLASPAKQKATDKATGKTAVEGEGIEEQGGLNSFSSLGMNNSASVPTLQTTLPAAAQQSSQAAVTGGARNSSVTINLGKLMENVNIYAREFREGLNDLDNKVLESLTRVLNVAQSSVI